MDSILCNDIRVPVILDRPVYTGKSIKEVYSKAIEATAPTDSTEDH
jgi:hypothetical protein